MGLFSLAFCGPSSLPSLPRNFANKAKLIKRIEVLAGGGFIGIHIRLLETKTTAKGATPKLLLKGRAAAARRDWLLTAHLTTGPLFRPISKSSTVLSRPLHPDAIRQILKRLLVKAGYDKTFASPHGLRSGFLTEAALKGTPFSQI